MDETETETTIETETRIESHRVKAVQDWLLRWVDTSLGRLALQWFRGYFEASRNSGCAATIYSALSVLPAALVAVAVLHPSGSDANTFAEHLVSHMKLTGSTASLVQGTFGSASNNALGATLTVVVTFLLWGIGIGQIYQDVYARAWGLKLGSIADQGLFAIFFFVVTGAIALSVVAASRFSTSGWIVLVPAWLVASTVFWLWVPWFLLHRKISLRALLPGALLASVVLGGAIATSPLSLAPPLNENGKTFGSFGIALTIVGYVFIIITMSLVCAVFSPVWANWRRTEKQLREERAPTGADQSVVAP
jgi:membrane protein